MLSLPTPRRVWSTLIWGVLLLLAALVTAHGGSAQPARSAPAASPPVAAAVPPQRIDDVEATERSVVRVVTVAIVRGEVVGFGHGSGFAVAPNRIVTNAHVVGDAAEYPDNVVIGIVPSEGSRSYPGRLIRIDRRRDLALVEIIQGRVPPASLYAGQPRQRDIVYALGYPGNVDLATARNMNDFIRPSSPVASDGIISSLSSIGGTRTVVHDADIARGNSGGPLVDRCGRVVGVNNAISRADDGDSPFSFAVSADELAAFLREAGQAVQTTNIACLTAEAAAARAQALRAEEQRIAAEAAQAARGARAIEAAERLEQLRAGAQRRSENFMALAFALFGIAILCGSASLSYQIQNRQRERRGAIIGGVLLTLGSIIIFLLRPDAADILASQRTADNPAPAAAATPAERYGAMTCTVDQSRGRITVSATSETSLDISPQGCVNGRTQYVRGPDGSWSRTLVPNQDATVTRISYDPVRRQSVTRRYLLPLDAMEGLRRQRAAVEVQGCTADPEQLATLNRRETAISTLLPDQPNEEIVADCTAAP